MGLLKKLSDSQIVSEKKEQAVVRQEPVQQKSNSVGLLKKSLIVSNEDGLDFFEFIEKYKLSHCALFTKKDNNYLAEFSFGFDGASICQSFSTVDFWEGVLHSEDQILFFNKQNELLPFYQFFSDELKVIIKSICIYKTKASSILLILNYPQDKVSTGFSNDIKKVKLHAGISKLNRRGDSKQTLSAEYKLNFLECIESFVLSEYKNISDKRIFTALSNALFYTFTKNFPSPDVLTFISDGIYNLGLYSKEKIPVELLSGHIKNDSRFFFGGHAPLMTLEEIH
ncbi:MAG: hypothetical protein K6G09_03965 [Treponema sp.]|nr:hypothetical protein [Treponema sp.]